MFIMEKSYNDGVRDGVKLWASACSKMPHCNECPIGVIKGTNLTCQEFIKQFPGKAVSLLSEMNKGEITYAQEFNFRFPDAQMTAEDLYNKGVCRKTIFEGYAECEGGDCIACWNETYVQDRSVDLSDESEDSEV